MLIVITHLFHPQFLVLILERLWQRSKLQNSRSLPDLLWASEINTPHTHCKFTLRELFLFSIIAQVIIEMRAFWLVEDYVISCYNHPARGNYNNEVLIFKMDTARFLDVFEEETNEMKKKKCSCSDNHLSNYTKTILLLRLSEYCRII